MNGSLAPLVAPPCMMCSLMTTCCVSSAVDRLNGSSSSSSLDLEDQEDPEGSEDPAESVSTVTRVMVSQNRLYSDSAEVVALQVFSEVIEVEGREVRLLLLQLQLHCLKMFLQPV